MAETKNPTPDVQEEVNPNDPEARRIREDAMAYADAVLAGEEPWNAPKNDDVGENGGTDEEPVEVPADIDNKPALDADDPIEGDEGVPGPDEA